MASRSLDTLLREKKKAKKKLLKEHNFGSDSASICVISIKDDAVRNFLIDGLGSLGVSCLVVGDVAYEKHDHISHVDRLNKGHLD